MNITDLASAVDTGWMLIGAALVFAASAIAGIIFGFTQTLGA